MTPGRAWWPEPCRDRAEGGAGVWGLLGAWLGPQVSSTQWHPGDAHFMPVQSHRVTKRSLAEAPAHPGGVQTAGGARAPLSTGSDAPRRGPCGVLLPGPVNPFLENGDTVSARWGGGCHCLRVSGSWEPRRHWPLTPEGPVYPRSCPSAGGVGARSVTPPSARARGCAQVQPPAARPLRLQPLPSPEKPRCPDTLPTAARLRISVFISTLFSAQCVAWCVIS